MGHSENENPYAEILSELPQEYQQTLQSKLDNYTQNIKGQYSNLEPYKEFVDNEVRPDDIRQSLGVVNAISENPQMVFQALAQELGVDLNKLDGQTEGNKNEGDEGEEPEYDLSNLPPEFVEQFEQLKNGYELLAQNEINRNQQTQEAQEDEELDQLYKQMAQENELFRELNKEGAAEPYISSLLMADYEPDEALKEFERFAESIAAYYNRPKPPTILGGGGAINMDTKVDPAKLDSKNTKNLVADMLRAAHAANQ